MEIMFKKETNSVLNVSVVLLVFFAFFYVLYIWKSILIPFIVAILFSFAIIGLSNFYKKLKIWNFLAFILSILTYIVIFWFIWKMIGSNIEDLIRILPDYQSKILSIFSLVFEFLPIPESMSVDFIFQKLDLQYIMTSVISAVTSIFSKAGIILFYVMFILLEYRFFKGKLNLMISDPIRKKRIFDIIEKIKVDVKSYFVIKTLVSFVTASLSYIVMRGFWLDLAVFWAFLIFVLNFIPSIGSVIAVSFPALLSLIQFDTYYTFVFLTPCLVWIQVLMWNIIEPKFIGNRLNLSPLVIILSLGFWGAIWWVVGMLLSVPLMVIINIILAKIPSTRSIAILLSEKWELDIDSGEEVEAKRKKLLIRIKSKLRGK
jgi:AI-2 transport protein TqsA